MKGMLRTIALVVCFSILSTIMLPVGRVNAYADESKYFSVSFTSPVWKGSEFSYSNVTITSPTGSHINTLSVFVDDGTITYLPSSSLWHTDLLQNGGHKSAIRVFEGSTDNSAEVAAIIKQIKFKLDNSKTNLDVTIIVDGQDTSMPTVAGYTVTRGKGNHYYVYVPQLLDWDKAYNAAKALEFMGMQGYLVTITSYEEDRLLDNITTVGAWAGAVRVPKSLSDSVFNKDTVWDDFGLPADPADSVWKWVCGPESVAGKNKIKITGSYGQVSEGIEDPGEGAYYSYSNWNRNSTEPDRGNEPNNFPTGTVPGEYCMSVHYHDKGEAGTEAAPVKGWNDLYHHVENLHEDYITGYFVEFDGLDITTPLTVSITKTENYSHKWEYTTVTDDDGDTEVKGECVDDSHEECDYGENGSPIEISIGIADHTYDASPAPAGKIKIAGVADSQVADTLTAAGASLDGSIMYSGTDLDGNVYGPSATPPTKTGTYTASQTIKAGGSSYTINSGFKITKALLTITLKNQTVIKDKPISQAVDKAVESASGLCGSDEIVSLVLDADNTKAGKHTIDISKTASKPVVVKNGAEDVTSCYEIKVIPAELTVSAKTPDIAADAKGSQIVYGKKLSDSTITGQVKDPDTGAVIPGTFKWKTPNVRPEVSDSNSTLYDVIFTPDSSDYEEIELKAVIPVVPKDIRSDDIDRTITLDMANSPEVTLYDNETGKTLIEGTDYTISTSRNGDKQEVTITGKGNYEKSFTVTLDRHHWTGRVIKQIVVDSSANELNPAIKRGTDSENERIGTAIILDKLSHGQSAKEKKAKTIINDIKNTGKSYDGDFNGLITLTMKNADGSATADEKACAESAINPGRAGDSVRIPKNAVIGLYFDVSLDAEYKVTDKSVKPEEVLVDKKDAVIDTSSATLGSDAFAEKIKITVPERLRPAKGYTRTYYIIRVHDDGTGSLSWMVMPVSRNDYDLTFSTDKFSIYALAYTETKRTTGGGTTDTTPGSSDGDTPTNNNTQTQSNTIVMSTPATSNTTVQVAAPKTGDSKLPFIGLFIILAGLVVWFESYSDETIINKERDATATNMSGAEHSIMREDR